MGKIIICRGIQGSGKSTWAKSWVAEDPKKRIRFNNDDIRNMLGPYTFDHEDLVKDTKINIAKKAMLKGIDIVIDNMNLNPKEIEFWNNICDVFNAWVNDSTIDKKGKTFSTYSIEFKNFFTPVDECIRRDAMRPNPIGEKIIKMTWNKYKTFILSEMSKNFMDNRIPFKDSLKSCIIVDLDGVLAYNTQGRPFFGSGTAEGIVDDTPDLQMYNIISNLGEHNKIFFLTGREDTPEIRNATQNWLNNLGITHSHFDFDLLMRPQGSRKKGSVQKKEVYEQYIKGKYNVLAVFEDQINNVNMWRNEGLLCLQPNNGNL